MLSDVEAVEKWQTFCLKVRDIGHVLMSHCGFDGSSKGITDPRVMASCILARTLSNLVAVRDLVMGGRPVEARTIARCCYENSFWIQGLIADGDGFVREMRRDEAASTKSRLEFIFASVGKQMDSDKEAALRERLRRDKELDPKPINPKEASSRGPLGSSYAVYGQLSADAAHPSLTALQRYLTKSVEGSRTIWTISAEPDPRPGEAVKTLEWACGAAIAVIIGVNQIYEMTPATETIRELMEEQVSLAGYN